MPGVTVASAVAEGTYEGTTGNCGVTLTRGVGVLLKTTGAAVTRTFMATNTATAPSPITANAGAVPRMRAVSDVDSLRDLIHRVCGTCATAAGARQMRLTSGRVR